MKKTSAPKHHPNTPFTFLPHAGKITRNKKVVIKLLKKNMKFLLDFKI